jgi:hypothetical protein
VIINLRTTPYGPVRDSINTLVEYGSGGGDAFWDKFSWLCSDTSHQLPVGSFIPNLTQPDYSCYQSANF